MLFNSYIFIFVFLPFVLFFFYFIASKKYNELALIFLLGASIFFYGWWNPIYLLLLISSVLVNYALGISIRRNPRKLVLFLGIFFNLGLIAYFKYANFFVENLNYVTGNDIFLEKIMLPLAISFFTFQQIAYLVDTFRGESTGCRFLHYCLFITFFPQLIAGPIVNHKEMMPQFLKGSFYNFKAKNLAVGLTIFSIGLFKKVILADGIAEYSTPVFDFAEQEDLLTFSEAWCGALSYTFQLYFDFSGYSDMAIGIARMFGLKLPVNFNSPYKSQNIQDFWRRWHITLSRLLQAYVYIPLGGNRKGNFKTYNNVMITFLLAGIWHGAGWNFIIFGLLHGFYLVVYSSWQKARSHIAIKESNLGKIFGWFLTIFCVVLAWVPFRSETMTGAINMWEAMLGLNGFSFPRSMAYLESYFPYLQELGIVFNGTFPNDVFSWTVSPYIALYWILSLGLISVLMPNTQEFMRLHDPAILDPRFRINIGSYAKHTGGYASDTYIGKMREFIFIKLEWHPKLFWSLFISFLFITSTLFLTHKSEFLYFQF